MSSSVIRVAIVDDHILTLKGAEQTIAEGHDIEVVLASTNGKDLLEYLKNNPDSIDVILVDLNMPIINGVELTKRITAHYGKIKIIVLTMIDEVNMIQRMLDYGANGYLLKNNIQNELVTAIQEVYKGNTYYNNNIREALFKSSLSLSPKVTNNDFRPKLSKREKEVLKLIIKEYTTPEIANELFISEGTVITHRRHLLTKMNAKNAAGLVRIAMDWGLVDLG